MERSVLTQPQSRDARQVQNDVLTLLYVIEISGSPLAKSHAVAQIAARYAEPVPSLEDVIEDAIQHEDWDCIRRVVPDLWKLDATVRMPLAGRILDAHRVAKGRPPHRVALLEAAYA